MSLLKDFKNIFDPKTTMSSDDQTPKLGVKKVLIVEDDALLSQALATKFKHEGFEVFTAANGQIGLDTAIAQNPNIIILDIMMPVMDGETMLHKLRQIPKFMNLPVVVLTNSGDIKTMQQTKVYDNANDYLVKTSVTTDDVVEKVKSLLFYVSSPAGKIAERQNE